MAFNPLAAMQAPPIVPADDSQESTGTLRDYLLSIIRGLPETLDHSEEVAAMGAAQKLKQIVAGRQKEKEAAMGTTPAHKFVARNSGAGY